MKYKLVCCLVLSLLFFSLLGHLQGVNWVQAQEKTQVQTESKVVLFIADRVSLAEWQQISTPYLDQLLAQGAVGLMNTTTAGSLEPKDTYLTLGSGNRATVGFAGYLNFNQQEEYREIKAAEIYQRRMGNLPEKNKIVNLELAQIKEQNLTSNYQAEIGKLNTTLSRANCRIAVLGNADIWQQLRRQVALIGFNSRGTVRGDVSRKMRRPAVDFPSGYLTDHNYLQQQFQSFYSTSDLLIVEAGDTSRVEAVKAQLTSQQFRQAKVRAIKRTDRLLGKIKEEINLAQDYLLVITPTPAKRASRVGRKLTLAVVVGPGIKRGLLTSATTERRGLITNLDLAPTIYQLLTGKKGNFSGYKFSSVQSAAPLEYLAEMQRSIQKTFSWRPTLVQVFLWLQILVLFIGGFVLIYRKKITFLKQIVMSLVVSLLWLPTFFLLSKLFLSYSLVTAGIIWMSVSLVLAAVSIYFWSDSCLPIVLPAAAISGLLVFDLWGGSEWTKMSVFSYSPVIGARYYGLGNEFMGLLIGAFIMGVMGLKELRAELPDAIILLLLSLLVVTIGAPQLGANFGGLITAGVVSTAVYLLLQGQKIGYKFLFRVALLVTGIVAVVIVIERLNLWGVETHLGHLLSSIRREGISELFLIISRKLQINWRLFRTTIWSRVLLAFMGVLLVLCQWPQGKVKKLLANYPYLAVGIKAAIAGSFVTLVVNDSGVVAAATLLLFPVFSLLYLGLYNQRWKLTKEE